mgnify:CR=1 FL=1
MSRYVGGIDACPRCGCDILSTGCDATPIVPFQKAEIKWYHRCVDCDYKIYIATNKNEIKAMTDNDEIKQQCLDCGCIHPSCTPCLDKRY